ncbi:uncharacterized protein [Nicotiana tomentosiformis]|uniref:uncharacterized protein n=1 Tax=Nicotiana tomentosiformis TaxID=4098 RepID=UPI00388C9FA1
MGMDGLYSCFSKLDCRTRTFRFEFPNESVIEWKGDDTVPKGRFISYLKATKMINKGCIYHLVRVTDSDVEAPTIECMPVVNEFPDVFLDELPGIPPDREIDFGIDVMPCTHPISIPPYKMAPEELKELKEQLEDLLEKGFIQPSHVVSREGIEVDPQEIAAGKNWPGPTTPTGIRSFLGLAGAHQRPLAKEVHRLASLGVLLANFSEGGVIVQNIAKSSLVMEVKENQYNDPLMVQLKEGIHKHKTTASSLNMDDGTLRYQGRLCVPNVDGLRKRIMTEAHTSRYFVHPGSIKMYHDLKEVYKWNDMKRNVAYRLELPPEMSLVHPLFHMSMLKKVVGDPSLIVSVDTIEVNEELTYEEIPVAILDRQVQNLRNKEIANVKVLW